MTGVQPHEVPLINSPAWYVSALMIISGLIYYLLDKHKGLYIKIIAPLSILLIYGYFYIKIGNIDVWWQVTGIKSALLRAFAGMNSGCVCYMISNKFKNYSFNKITHNLLNIVEIFFFCFVIIFAFFKSHTQIDFLLVLLLAIAITVTFISKGFVDKRLDNGFTELLGKISYPMFLNHLFIMWLFVKYMPNETLIICPIFICTTFAYSIFTYIFSNCILNRLRKIK